MPASRRPQSVTVQRFFGRAEMVAATIDPMQDILSLYAVQERDIDLLLLEETHTSPEFVSWFAGCVGLRDAVFDKVCIGVCSSDGETDLLLRVLVGDERVGILIEENRCARTTSSMRKIFFAGSSMRKRWMVRSLPHLHLRTLGIH